MSPELEGRIYENVLREVIWGAERDTVLEMLQANGISSESAERLFRKARQERIALLRTEGVHKAVKGLLLTAAGIALFCVFWYGLGWIIRQVIILSGLLCAWGLWWSASGTMDILLAPSKRGSVAADD